jgi:glucosamine--fructose-6-phosphate aminotransferase (isomerizing)
MCGIFGIVSADGQDIASDLKSLFLLSESRGKEAAGLALVDGGEITILKEPQAASRMMRRSSYRGLIGKLTSNHRTRPITAIGHSRLVTNGLDAIASNNQPVLRESLIGIHNGIIVNDEKLWAAFGLKRTADVDTEVLLALIEHFRRGGASLGKAAALAFREIEGTASVAILAADDPRLILGTNNGSLHIFDGGKDGAFYYASERHILRSFLMKKRFSEDAADAAIETVPGGLIVVVDTVTRAIERVSVAAPIAILAQDGAPEPPTTRPRRIVNLADALDPRRVPLRRCTRCIMPETMPFISFDADGVCNYCRTYEPQRPRGLDELRELVAPYRRRDGRPDCLIAVSGGRDSCYGLHIIKRELGLNPVAYTYDWGVITDLARRNQARLCGKLGIEHILVSADIRRKREYVRRNVNAWLKKPSLGMIPLFMAGDKQYFYYADQTRRQLHVDLSFLCENRLERAHFKSGFMGVNEGHNRVFNIGLWKKLILLSYYGKEYLRNPRYINRSLLDTVMAFYSSYFLDHSQIQLFEFAEWNEDELVEVLRGKYDWELAPDTTSTWRIGDGTAAFYNYIYWTVAGFTENDALRSNQIREGVIERETALALVNKENEPRWESMRWYASTIGFSLNDALQVINSMPRLYQLGRPAIEPTLEPAIAY